MLNRHAPTYDFAPAHDTLEAAKEFDKNDTLAALRQEFHFPEAKATAGNAEPLYFAGHSLGLMPKKAKTYVDQELESWAKYAVEGHFKGAHPWLPYHENITASFARLVGARPSEVVAMNSLTVNLHLMLVSFYRPTAKRFKILIENNTFPSDKYAVDSQVQFHGFSPRDAVVELQPRAGEMFVRPEDVMAQIDALGDSLALVMLGNCNYLSGQQFNFEQVVQAAHSNGALAGFNLAHGAGNLQLSLHDWNVDFAVWCSYKYLNSGPGGIAGAFVHEKHLGKKDLPRFAGWWGHDKTTRFDMGPQFQPLPTAEAWQQSNPPIFQLAALRASMELFDQATMLALRKKGDQLTSYFDWLLKKNLAEDIEVITPALPQRGSMLCMKFKKPTDISWQEKLLQHGAYVDFRKPNIIRATPVPIYNSFEDIYRLLRG